MLPSRYNLIHALAAAAVLLTAVFWQGFVPFWRQFVYGLAVPMTPAVMLQSFLLTAALTSLDKWKSSRLVRGLLRGIRPATVALMLSALIVFGGMSVWRYSSETGLAGLRFSPVAIAIAVLSKKKVGGAILWSVLGGAVAYYLLGFTIPVF